MALVIDIVPFYELSRSDVAEWHKIQDDMPQFRHPFFSPSFTETLSSVHPQVRVALLRSQGATFGFFPFQFTGPGQAEPVGGRISDYQAVIARQGCWWDVEHLFRACGIRNWQSRHLLADQIEFQRWHTAKSRSLVIDLTRGFAGWAADLDERGSAVLLKAERAERNLKKDYGPVVFHQRSTSVEELRHLMNCKSDQYLRTGSTDRFAIQWIKSALEYLQCLADPGCTGVLSTLSFDATIVASHFGLRSKTIWHYWFPCYSTSFAKYSPGLLLLIKMVQSASATGILCFDLGAGDSPYKLRLATSDICLAECSISIPSGT